MRKMLFACAFVGALVYAAPAAAGCWATAQLSPPPAGITAGSTWTAELTVLQHGNKPLPDAASARPTLTIKKGSERKTFTASPVDAARGTYTANVVFPSGGQWSFAVFDDFTSSHGQPVPCSRTHELGSVQVAGGPGSATGSSGGFPAGRVARGFGIALIAAAGLFLVARRARRTAVA
jgi:hypothetical protein